jgi:cobalt-zinc-cadmium efflux system protein
MHAQHHHRHDREGPQRTLGLTLVLTAAIMVAEVVGGWWSGSLALFADAGHMLTDVLALAVAFAALALGARPADDRRTYGYRRLEILAALANGGALVIVSGAIVYEAYNRWVTPAPVNATVMAVIAVIGLFANLAGLFLMRGHRHNLNVRGAFLHVLGDTLSSVGVLVGAGVIALTGWTRIDPLLSVGISGVIIYSSFSLLREVVDVLLEAAPAGIDTEKVRRLIAGTAGVDAVHDLHIWTIASGMPALSVHVVMRDHSTDCDQVRRTIQEAVKTAFAIDHTTLQVEHTADGDCGCCPEPDAAGDDDHDHDHDHGRGQG